MPNKEQRGSHTVTTKTKWLVSTMVLVMVVLHQDVWFWTDPRLVLGFVPVGLAYHAAYSMLAACFMAVLVKIAWPSHLEEHFRRPRRRRTRR